MKTTLLDSSLILTCVKQKIDFFEFLESEGIQTLIPEEVIKEIKGISKTKDYGKLALQILKKNRFKEISLNSKNTDVGIIKFAEENPNAIIGTLDREIKKKTKNHKLVIRGKNNLEVI